MKSHSWDLLSECHEIAQLPMHGSCNVYGMSYQYWSGLRTMCHYVVSFSPALIGLVVIRDIKKWYQVATKAVSGWFRRKKSIAVYGQSQMTTQLWMCWVALMTFDQGIHLPIDRLRTSKPTQKSAFGSQELWTFRMSVVDVLPSSRGRCKFYAISGAKVTRTRGNGAWQC
jgi:hypothetical protein